MRSDNLDKIIQLRHTLHQCAELSMAEAETMRTLIAFLREHTSLQVHDRGSWFYAVKNRQKGSSKAASSADTPAPIAFRADMDALPIPETIDLPYASAHTGVSHKCGHDGHSAALCGLALELEEIETGMDVYLIFQPGEETGQGALACRNLVLEKGIGEIYAFHNLGGYPEGSIVYREGLTQPASEGLRIRLTGATSHASAPEKGRNPAAALARIVLAAQELSFPDFKNRAAHSDPALTTPAKNMRLCTITGIDLGSGDFGISPGVGEVYMTLRAEAEADMKDMEASILRFAQNAALAEGLEIRHSIHDYFPETRNHDQCLRKVVRAAKGLGMPVIPMDRLWRASEDFGHYLKECPGAMFYIGNGEGYPPLHTVEYDFNDRILEKAVDLFAALIG